MSEASFESVLAQLREVAPAAPDRLREQVRALRPAESRIRPWLRPALLAAVVVAIAVSALAAALVGSGHKTGGAQSSSRALAGQTPHDLSSAERSVAPSRSADKAFAPSLAAQSRLQKQDVAMRLRVDDLSGATQSAVRTTRRLGGFVAGADYATGARAGNSRLALRVPVANLQRAIASFTNLGTILSQHISVADLQTGLDRLDLRIAKARRENKEQTLERLQRRRDALIREGTYARVSLQLTTAKAAQQAAPPPGRFDRFLDNSGDILGKEAIAVLYALVVIGPFVLIAALLLLAERTRRRRADHRLLEETG
jgi:Domain of unknown function (DUF4349)